MSSIVLRVNELFDRISEMKNDGFDYVELRIFNASGDDSAFIHFDGYKISDADNAVDFEELDAIH